MKSGAITGGAMVTVEHFIRSWPASHKAMVYEDNLKDIPTANPYLTSQVIPADDVSCSLSTFIAKL